MNKLIVAALIFDLAIICLAIYAAAHFILKYW